MNRYWMVLAMLGAVACSGVAVEEDSGSNTSAVTDKGDVKDTDPGKPAEGTKPDDGKPVEGTKPDDGKPDGNEYPDGTEPADGKPDDGTKVWEPGISCEEELAWIAAQTEGVTDPVLLANLKTKYEQSRQACAPTATCDEQLAVIADMTANVTDPVVLANLKTKYEQLRLDCQEPAVDPGPKPSN